MSTRCKICTHPLAREIDEALRAGAETLEAIVSRYQGFSIATLKRHKAAHLIRTPPPAAPPAKAGKGPGAPFGADPGLEELADNSLLCSEINLRDELVAFFRIARSNAITANRIGLVRESNVALKLAAELAIMMADQGFVPRHPPKDVEGAESWEIAPETLLLLESVDAAVNADADARRDESGVSESA